MLQKGKNREREFGERGREKQQMGKKPPWIHGMMLLEFWNSFGFRELRVVCSARGGLINVNLGIIDR